MIWASPTKVDPHIFHICSIYFPTGLAFTASIKRWSFQWPSCSCSAALWEAWPISWVRPQLQRHATTWDGIKMIQRWMGMLGFIVINSTTRQNFKMEHDNLWQPFKIKGCMNVFRTEVGFASRGNWVFSWEKQAEMMSWLSWQVMK